MKRIVLGNKVIRHRHEEESVIKICSLLIVLVLLFVLTEVGLAKFEYVPLKEVVTTSDLIVIGTLKEVKIIKEIKQEMQSIQEYEGTIYIEEYLTGDTLSKNRCILRWTFTSRLRPTISHQEAANKKYIWLLQKHIDDKKEPYYTANYPFRRCTINMLETIKSLVKSPLQLTIKSDKEVYEVGEPIIIDAELTNISDKTINPESLLDWNAKDAMGRFVFSNQQGQKCQLAYVGPINIKTPAELFSKGFYRAWRYEIDLEKAKEQKRAIFTFELTKGQDYMLSGRHSIYLEAWGLTSNTITIEVKAKK